MRNLLLILFIEIIIIVSVIFIVNSFRDIKIPRKIVNSFNNCDLLSVCIPNLNGKMVQLFTGSRITHLGIIVVIDSEPYVLEVGYYNNVRGSNIMLLDKWLRKYRYLNIQYLRYKGPIKTSGELLNIYHKLAPCDINLNLISWIRTLSKISYSETTHKTSYFCTEFIVTMLQELNIMKKIYQPYCYTPRSIMYLQRDMFPDQYEHVVELVR